MGVRFVSLPGLTSYADATAIQRQRVEDRIADRIPDTVILLEHSPVITRGRGLQGGADRAQRHMPLPAALPKGVEFSDSERGGDLTYHGPGQIVIYPIFKLDGCGGTPAHDVGAYLRGLEGVLIRVLGELGLSADRRAGATGVWVGERKIASIGVAVRRWVTYHGAALNVVNDLSGFKSFNPCGFSSEVMTRVQDLVAVPPNWREWIEGRIVRGVESSFTVMRNIEEVSLSRSMCP